MHRFEHVLMVSQEDIEFRFWGISDIVWTDFWLNPRRLRGSDFLMRWSQGVWSEHRILEAINATSRFFAIPYGPSGTAPTEDVRAFELYFERLEHAGLGKLKRPDLLVFDVLHKPFVEEFLQGIGGAGELAFIPEIGLKDLLKRAKLAIECENSLWVAEKMPAYNKPLRPQKRLGGQLRLAKDAVVPTVIIKDEDLLPLKQWQQTQKIPIHVWQVFFDRAYGLALDTANELLEKRQILATAQEFQAPGGATTRKAIYKFYHHYAYFIGVARNSPQLIPAYVQDKNGHILPYVKFEGGNLELAAEALQVLEQL